MHVVYQVVFDGRIERNEKPYFYIGSKGDCRIENGLIYSNKKRKSKPYWGSSTDKNYYSAIKESNKHIEILYTFEDYFECLQCEREVQMAKDVVANNEFFNKSLARENTFHLPNYATYKNIETGKIVRLPVNHEKVLSGEYVGVSKGSKLSEDIKHRISESQLGEKNHFYKKTHSESAKLKMRLAKLKT